MILSTTVEYLGDCHNALNFYAKIFKNSAVKFNTFHDMPMAEMLGILNDKLDYIYKSQLDIPFGSTCIRLELADSMFAAMNKEAWNTTNLFNPLFCIKSQNDKLKSLAGQLDVLLYSRFDRPLITDVDLKSVYITKTSFYPKSKYGLSFSFETGPADGIFYLYEVDGYCRQVMDYYEQSFGIKAENVVTYADSPFADKINGDGKEYIFEAVLKFWHGDICYGLMINDSPESVIYNINTYNPKDLLFYRGHNPILNLRCDDNLFLSQSFGRLSQGAKLNKPLAKDEDGTHGSLIDRFGICWNFYDCYQSAI